MLYMYGRLDVWNKTQILFSVSQELINLWMITIRVWLTITPQQDNHPARLFSN